MRLLVTNDDGISSGLLRELVHALRAAEHELVVVAPKVEQSWIGAAKSRHRPVASREVDHGFGCPTWSVDGTPSDCVNIALAHLAPRDFAVDAVVSGINAGLNASLGFILASGTIGGACEGAVHGYPAVAFSQDLTAGAFDRVRIAAGSLDPELEAMIRVSASRAAQLLTGLVAASRPRSFVVHNVNFPYPCLPDSEIRRTVPARVVVPGLFSPAADDGTHRFVFQQGEDISSPEPLTDRAAIAAGFISHTVLDYTALGRD